MRGRIELTEEDSPTESLFQESHLRTMLRGLCEASTQKAVAKELGVSPQYLSDVLKGRREVGERLARALGFTRHLVFQLEVFPTE